MRNFRTLVVAIACGLAVVAEAVSGIPYTDRAFSVDASYSQWRKSFEQKFLKLGPTLRYNKLIANFNRLESRRKAVGLGSRDEFEWLLTIGTVNASVSWPIYFEKYPSKLSSLEKSTDFEVLRARWLSDRRYTGSIASLRKFGQRLLMENPRDYWVLHAFANMEGSYAGGDSTAGLAYIDRLAKLKPNDPWTEFRWARLYEYRLFADGRKSDLDKAKYHFKRYFESTQDPDDLVKSMRGEFERLVAKGSEFVKRPEE